MSEKSSAFDEALTYLYGFINFEKEPQDRHMSAKLDSSRPKRFMDGLGAPYAQYPTIHIAGTKGKGSVAAMCASCLREAGYRVGLFTSPHLQNIRERIRILTPEDGDGRISEAQFIEAVERIKEVEPQFPGVTWFEILTAVAFLHFAQQKVDVAVIEVGLGGRLDSTNVVTPLVSVITSLSLDHTKFLGNTMRDIAYEKGGIIKEGVPVIAAAQVPEAMQQLQEICVERESPLSIVGQNWQYELGEKDNGRFQELIMTESPAPEFIPSHSKWLLNLVGEHQLENGAVAVATLAQVRPYLPKLTLNAVKKGLANVQWNGRLQTLHQGDAHTPTLLIDGAHNPDSAQKLSDAIQANYEYNRLWLVIGAPKDKDILGMLTHLVPLASGVITTTAQNPRSASPEEITEMCATLGKEATTTEDMATALTLAWETAVAGDLICVTGSLIVVGELLNQWERLQSQLLENKF